MNCLLLVLVMSLFGLATSGLQSMSAGQSKAFSVTSYGAKGDGVTDDGPSIAKAITAAIAVGGRVTFPCGEFSLQSVTGGAPAERSLLYFKGARNLQLVGQGRCSHLVTTIPQKSVLEFEDSTGISIASLRITALNVHFHEKYGMAGGSAVRFSGVNRGNISHVEVDGAAGAALYLTKGAANILVSNNFVHDTYAAAVWKMTAGLRTTGTASLRFRHPITSTSRILLRTPPSIWEPPLCSTMEGDRHTRSFEITQSPGTGSRSRRILTQAFIASRSTIRRGRRWSTTTASEHPGMQSRLPQGGPGNR